MTVYDYSAQRLDGHEERLSDYRGQVLLIVNTASQCGFTPQYAGLEKLYEKLHGGGLAILGFPCNQFGAQEPGSEAEIGQFCLKNYGVTFPMFAKISVKGGDQAPLYQFLTDKSANPKTGGEIQWNFTKFLVDRNGRVIQRFEPAVEPESAELVSAVEAALKK